MTTRPDANQQATSQVTSQATSPARVTAGVVLTGGSSRRMGTNKAVMLFDGRALAVRVAESLIGAGCEPVWFQGGDAPALQSALSSMEPAHRSLVSVVDDAFPGRGPVAAIGTALQMARVVAPHVTGVVIAACDLVDLDAATVTDVIAAGKAGAVTVAIDPVALQPGHRQRRHLLSWWSVDLVDAVVALTDPGGDAAVTSYQRLLQRIGELAGVDVIDVEVMGSAIRNINSPHDIGES